MSEWGLRAHVTSIVRSLEEKMSVCVRYSAIQLCALGFATACGVQVPNMARGHMQYISLT